MKTNPNDPAFEPLIWKQMPLTKREYFAAMAMCAVMQSDRRWTSDMKTLPAIDACSIAAAGIAFADALIAELNK